MAGNEDGAGDSKTPTADGQFTTASDKLRETAKWLVTVFGALGGALITSLSVSNLAQVSGGKLLLALLGFALGMGGTALVIFSVARVLLVTDTSLSDISGQTADSELVGTLGKYQALLGGFPNTTKLAETHLAAQGQRIESYERMLHPPDDPEFSFDAEKLRFERASKELMLTSPVVDRVLGFAGFLRLRGRFVTALVSMAFGFVAVSVGIGLFAYNAKAPAENQQAAIVAGRPVQAVVDLNATGEDTYRQLLGDRCDLNHIEVLALASSANGVNVITEPGRSCNLEEFVVTPELGSVCPVSLVLPSSLPPPGDPGSTGISCP
jgi:hypothetical protein